jgi:hypothetical protein
MTINLLVRVETIQSGAAARAVNLPLAGHGRDPDRAVASLVRGVVAWGHGLAATGELEAALSGRGIRWQADEHDLTIAPEVVPA